jgi:hypothetical protein
MIPFVCCTIIYTDCVTYNLGSLEMKLGSNVAFEKYELMDLVCGAMRDFLDTAYHRTTDRNNGFSCFMYADDIDIDGTSAPYTANITFYAGVTFAESTKWTQNNVTDLTKAIFAVEDGDQSFLHALMEQSNSDPYYPFLSNITYATVKMNSDVVHEGIHGICGFYESSGNLNVPIIAAIGGLGAFFLVLCAVRSRYCYYRLSRLGVCTAKLHDCPHEVAHGHYYAPHLLPNVMTTQDTIPCNTVSSL